MLRIRLAAVTAFLFVAILFVSRPAYADSLTIHYTNSQSQTDIVGPGFTQIDFTGFVTNNTSSPITFQLTGGPVPFEPYVASFVNGIPYPGITLGAGQSSGLINLAVVTINPFDPSLNYPGTVDIVLDAITVDPVTGHTGGVITEDDASIQVISSIPEPSTLLLLMTVMSVFALTSIYRTSVRSN